ncbi:hypothetical protein RISW2_19075 [Roseivivax isoporae LMG 25204]|uniref:Uncharacterized protein n=1 Tax=Roseivivax isoporae LMG 25204 TaxID=1449351 RepID=X7F3Y2_9RHOB|nr:hypothetical protein RISW2_19075 [Roseivivax isoporae LMG 25204]
MLVIAAFLKLAIECPMVMPFTKYVSLDFRNEVARLQVPF